MPDLSVTEWAVGAIAISVILPLAIGAVLLVVSGLLMVAHKATSPKSRRWK